MKTITYITVLLCMLSCTKTTTNPNFHIYLCFGQSNMEGQGEIEEQDLNVNPRLKVLQAIDCTNLGYEKATWRTAEPPICQCYSGLSPADYFGRTMIEHLPETLTVGLISVAVGGCDIRLFDKEQYTEHTATYSEDWFTTKVADYGGNPYQHLINLAKKAQQDGVIKGILLHQGETNTGDEQWPYYVKTIYQNMLNDLSLKAEDVPLLVGEVVSVEPNCCAEMNPIINQLPNVIPTAKVVSSAGCTAMDNAHFNSQGYRQLGIRYAQSLIQLNEGLTNSVGK